MQRALVVASVVVALLLGGAGCLSDAPRDNPFDPDYSTGDRAGSVLGVVTDRAARSLQDVEVRLIPETTAGRPMLVARTDGQGRFTFGSVPAGQYELIAAKVGYADTLETLRVDRGQRLSRELRLNALPFFSQIRLNTVHDSRWWPLPTELYRLEVLVEVTDPDQRPGVDVVWLEIPELSFADTLIQVEGAPGRFTGVIQESDLPEGDLHALLGKVLRLKVRDQGGAVNVSEPQTLVRVIDPTPVTLNPAQGMRVSPGAPMQLAWEALRLPYNFTYRIDLFRDELQLDIRVRSVLDISSDSTSVRITAPDSRGSYYWTLSVIDDFGNRSRSKEAGIQVE